MYNSLQTWHVSLSRMVRSKCILCISHSCICRFCVLLSFRGHAPRLWLWGPWRGQVGALFISLIMWTQLKYWRMGYFLSNEEKLSTWRDKWRKSVNMTRQMGLMWKYWWGLLWHKLSSVQTAYDPNKQVSIKKSQNNTAWYCLAHLVASKSPMTHLGMLRRRKVRTIIDIILVMMTINMMMVIIRMMMTIILCPPGQMHFFPSRLGLGLLEPAEAEFEVLFITILPHFSNITLSL